MINIENSTFCAEPWPHIIVENIIDDPNVLDVLTNNYNLPNYMSTFDEPVKRVEFNEQQLRGMHDVPPQLCQALHALNTNKDIVNLLETHFMEYLLEEYPSCNESYFKNLSKVDYTYGGYNTTNEEAELKGAHIDNGTKIYSGMIYFREPGDEDPQANLVLHKTDDQGNVIEEKVIQYGNNVAIFWPNLTYTWHSVQPRSPSTYIRRFINFVATGDKRLHDYTSNPGGVRDYSWRVVNKIS